MERYNKELQNSIYQFIAKLQTDFPVIIEITIYSNQKGIFIDLIEVRPGFRRTGIGSQVLKEILKICQQKRLLVTLTPDNGFGTPLEILHRFYSKAGFEKITGGHPDWVGGLMIWMPK